MTQKTKLRTYLVEPNDNISFPIGTILTVQRHYKHLGLSGIFGKHKKRGRDINIDWTSFVQYGEKYPLGKRGYSRDHRPDKKQITMGISELCEPIKISLMNLTVTVEYKTIGWRKTHFL